MRGRRRGIGARAALIDARADGERAAARLQGAADGVVKTARLLLRGVVDKHDGDVALDVQKRIAAVADDDFPVDIQHEVGDDVRDIAVDDEGLRGVLVDLDIGIAVLDGVDELFGRRDDVLRRTDEIDHVVVRAVGIESAADVARIREGIGKRRRRQRNGERRHHGHEKDRARLVFHMLAPPKGSSELCTKSAAKEMRKPRC